MSSVRASMTPPALARYVAAQLNGHFPDEDAVTVDDLMPVMPRALERLKHCFSAVNNKYFFDGAQAVFSHLHGDQYCIFLYLLSNELYRQGGAASTCSKLFLLNKALHGCDIFYEVELPSIFLVVHPLGTVLGRGNYSDYFVAYQRVGIGSNHDIYPTLGAYVTLRPGAAVLGNSNIGEGCQIAAESLVIDRDLPPDSLYIGNPKTATIKPNAAHYPLWRTSRT